jgi:hypothetical protein
MRPLVPGRHQHSMETEQTPHKEAAETLVFGRSRTKTLGRRMSRIKHLPSAPTQAPTDHIKRDCVIELPYLDAGRRVFVATDENGWMIAHGMGLGDAECQRVIGRLNDALEAHHQNPRPRLVSDA